MIVDADLLRMGADFSDSAGTLVRRGADTFAAAQVRAGIFGNFAEAEAFHRALGQAQEIHATSMRTYHSTLAGLAEKAVLAATLFTSQDHEGARSLHSAGRGFDS
jgi:hypothetical protein